MYICIKAEFNFCIYYYLSRYSGYTNIIRLCFFIYDVYVVLFLRTFKKIVYLYSCNKLMYSRYSIHGITFFQKVCFKIKVAIFSKKSY